MGNIWRIIQHKMGIIENNINSPIGDLHWTASACKVLLVQLSSAASRFTAAANSLQETFVICYNSMPIEHEFCFTIPYCTLIHSILHSVYKICKLHCWNCANIWNNSETKCIKRIFMSIMKAFFEEIQNQFWSIIPWGLKQMKWIRVLMLMWSI